MVFVAGSTQAPEEELASRVYQSLENKFPELRLIIVPRHPERFDEVARMLEREQILFDRRTELELDPVGERKAGRSSIDSHGKETRAILVDTVGELGGWWGCADIGFVGGSMGSRGGQNMIEPAAYGVATCFGPNTKNFRAIVSQLLQNDAACVVHDENELREFVEVHLSDPPRRAAIGNRAKQLVCSQRGATDTTIRRLLDVLKADGFSQQACISPPSSYSTDLRSHRRSA